MKTPTPFARILLVVLGLQFPAAATAETSWEKAIEAVEAKSSEYFDYAFELGSGYPGTALNGIGSDRHICAITGRMLGFHDEIHEAETFDSPAMTTDADPFALMEHSVFLDAWVASARTALGMTETQRKSLWNLECPGKHGIPTTAFIDDPELQGDFSVDGGRLMVYGDIDLGFYERFVEALDKNPAVTEVSLGSAGGNVMDALLSSLEIRKRGLGTTLYGPCYSACPLVFMGGESRTIWMGPGPHLGFHRVYTTAGEVPLDDEVYTYLSEYMVAMGVDPVPVLGWMMRAGMNEMYEPALDDFCAPKVATWVQRIC